jgi:hypothetical protein
VSSTSRHDWSWLKDTYWYCPAVDMPALQTQPDNTFAWVVDQTVWRITGYRDGYFWGVASTLLTPVGDTPDAAQKSDATFFASITPDGRVHITFIRSTLSTTIGIGIANRRADRAQFSMQMSSGPASSMVVHWAQMLQITPDDPTWMQLPGAGVSASAMVDDIVPPQLAALGAGMIPSPASGREPG